MKKCIALILALVLVLCFAGCQSGAQNADNTQNAGNQETGEVFAITYRGTEIKLGAPAEPIIQALGEPMKYTESASCAFEGLDRQYFYGSLYLETYPDGDKQFVYGWWFADDSVSTPEGIYIGSSQSQVVSAYGEEGFNGSNAFTIKQANGTLTIILEEEAVTSIQYSLNVE